MDDMMDEISLGRALAIAEIVMEGTAVDGTVMVGTATVGTLTEILTEGSLMLMDGTTVGTLMTGTLIAGILIAGMLITGALIAGTLTVGRLIAGMLNDGRAMEITGTVRSGSVNGAAKASIEAR